LSTPFVQRRGAAGVSLDQLDEVEPQYLTAAEIHRRERWDLFALLQKTVWKIKDVNGATELLEVKPTPLISRITKMGLRIFRLRRTMLLLFLKQKFQIACLINSFEKGCTLDAEASGKLLSSPQ
jgi:hypothetical protein